MEPTLTRNSALYFAQHKISKRRTALFQKLRAAASNQAPDVWKQLTLGDLIVGHRLHKDNGR
jgi:hypothetical protein